MPVFRVARQPGKSLVLQVPIKCLRHFGDALFLDSRGGVPEVVRDRFGQPS